MAMHSTNIISQHEGLREVTGQQEDKCWVRIRHTERQNLGLQEGAEGCSEAD